MLLNIAFFIYTSEEGYNSEMNAVVDDICSANATICACILCFEINKGMRNQIRIEGARNYLIFAVLIFVVIVAQTV